jgi:hypothetical protein
MTGLDRINGEPSDNPKPPLFPFGFSDIDRDDAKVMARQNLRSARLQETHRRRRFVDPQICLKSTGQDQEDCS